MKNKFFLKHAMHFATLCAVLAMILFVAASILNHPNLPMILNILAGALIISGGVILYLAHRNKSSGVHYFLYDRRRNITLPESELTFALIREGIDLYIADYACDAATLWQDIPQKLRIQLEGDSVFIPLIAYRMLWELSSLETTDICVYFAAADKRAVGYVCRAIGMNGDADMADYIYEMKKNAERAPDRIALFFSKNQARFEERMLRYVRRHASEFYRKAPGTIKK